MTPGSHEYACLRSCIKPSMRLDRFVRAVETELEPEADSMRPVCSRRRDGLSPPREQT